MTPVEARQSELYQRWASDLGGAEYLTAGQDAVLVLTAQAFARALTADSYLRRSHETIGSPRTLKAIAVCDQATATVFRGATILGIGRKTKPVLPIEAWAALKQERS
jgi:hypothetical protein